MSTKLIYSRPSPYARSARICLRELKLSSIEEWYLHPFDNPEDLIKANPLCKVPCLLVDGEAIFDSEVICRYLDSQANGDLFRAIDDSWTLRTLYSLTRGLLDSAVAWQQESMREPEQRSDFWQQRYVSSIERGLNYIAAKLEVFPEVFSALHINLLTVLEYLDFRHADYQWMQRHPQLQELYQQYKSRSSLTATAPTN